MNNGYISTAEKNNMYVRRYSEIVEYAKRNGYVTVKEFPTTNTMFKFREATKMIKWIKDISGCELTFISEGDENTTGHRIIIKTPNDKINDLGCPLGSQLNAMLCGVELMLDDITKKYE